jgi:hypothetical protein
MMRQSAPEAVVTGSIAGYGAAVILLQITARVGHTPAALIVAS